MNVRAVILAAGQGTRMRSKTPKVLHPILGKAMAHYALEAAQKASEAQPVLVVGHAAGDVRRSLGEAAEYVVQENRVRHRACPPASREFIRAARRNGCW